MSGKWKAKDPDYYREQVQSMLRKELDKDVARRVATTLPKPPTAAPRAKPKTKRPRTSTPPPNRPVPNRGATEEDYDFDEDLRRLEGELHQREHERQIVEASQIPSGPPRSWRDYLPFGSCARCRGGGTRRRRPKRRSTTKRRDKKRKRKSIRKHNKKRKRKRGPQVRSYRA